jgi:hypothetical protein
LTERVEYDLKPEDWAAFAEHCALRSRAFRQRTTGLRLMGLLAGLILIAVRGPSVPNVMLGALLAGVLWWGTPGARLRSVAQQALARKRPCNEGRHILEASDEGLRAKCDLSESLLKWPAVRAIDSRDTHVFVMVGESLGYVVPRSRVISGDLDRFLEAVGRRVS